METAIIIILGVTLLTFLTWFFWRRNTPLKAKLSQSLPPTQTTEVEPIKAARSKIAPETARPVLPTPQTLPTREAHQALEQIQPAVLGAPTAAPPAIEPDISLKAVADMPSPAEPIEEKVQAADLAASVKQSLPQGAEINQAPQKSESTFSHEEHVTSVNPPDVTEHIPVEKPIVLHIAKIATPPAPIPAQASELHAQEPTSPEASIIPPDKLPSVEPAVTPSEVQALPSPEPEQAGQETDESEKAPQRYRPPRQNSSRQPASRPAKREAARPSASTSESPLEIRVRLTFDRFNVCQITLLPERTPALDDEVMVKFNGTSECLMAQEDWYQDLQFENINGHLREGVELKGTLRDNRRVRWLLTGRDLFVLAQHQRASGFISTNRLVLGRSHLVLCTAELLPKVEAILSEAGCGQYTRLHQSSGVPIGWVGLRGISPTKALALEAGVDPFYAIKPAPDIEIELEGGVCLRNSIWLAGYPPRIKLLGQSIEGVKVLIDGKEARLTAEGFLTVDGYDAAGQPHVISCEGLSCSRSYSIEEPPDSWQPWPAHEFGEAKMCGPLVELMPAAASRRTFSVPMSNPLLIGAELGQIFRCSQRNVARWKGFVPFDVVWAMPANPLHCDKKTARILQFADAPFVSSKSRSKAALKWCSVVLDASRKGLQIDNGSPESIARWREYKKAARTIWRAA